MKDIIIFVIFLTYIMEIKARLLVRTTDIAVVSKNDDFKTVSITKHCLHDHEKHERKGRSHSEISQEKNNNFKRSVEKAKVPLVKKPIPMYVEINYEEDYQTRLVRWPEKYRDSSENEDEDFNVDDYEFDVNHDEFAARGKPVEPRVKLDKNYGTIKSAAKLETKPTTPGKKTNTEPVTTRNKNPVKREDIEKATEKARKSKQDDYYDDITTRMSEKLVKIVYSHEDVGDEVDESGERDRRGSVRTIRSPWDIGIYMDKLGEKTSLLVDKVLSILPMFPQIPPRKDNNK
ncbi:uncharacterized protein [Battus philenor]|uniref:uncharacterized protein n=1 Tax=Battus philenor TaxID=42288 RepID=UPI0035CF0FC7